MNLIKNITARTIVWSIILLLILILPVIMQFTDEISVGEAVAYGVLLLIAGGFYELWKWLKIRTKKYRIAFGIGFGGALLLGWANGAVGIIGSENNPANLMYGAVFAVGLVGCLLSQLRPRGMVYTLFTAAIVQLLIPVIALFIWPAQASWGDAGVIGVFIINVFFALIFVGSSLVFRQVYLMERKNN